MKDQSVYMPEHTRVEEFCGTIAIDLLEWCEDALKQEISFRVRTRYKYDIQKIEEYLLDGLRPVTAKDLPDDFRSLYFAKMSGDEPITLRGERLYVIGGVPRDWEHRKLFEMIRGDDDEIPRAEDND